MNNSPVWKRLVREVAEVVRIMPLWKLQTVENRPERPRPADNIQDGGLSSRVLLEHSRLHRCRIRHRLPPVVADELLRDRVGRYYQRCLGIVALFDGDVRQRLQQREFIGDAYGGYDAFSGSQRAV